MQDVGLAELMEGAYASEETLHSSVAFLRNTLTGKQPIQEWLGCSMPAVE